jgi:hypothetical protein
LTPFISISQIFLYTLLCKRIGSTILFFVVTVFIKRRIFLKNPQKPIPFSLIPHCIHGMSLRVDSQNGRVVTNGNFYLIILNIGSGSTVNRQIGILGTAVLINQCEIKNVKNSTRCVRIQMHKATGQHNIKTVLYKLGRLCGN